MHYYLRNFRKCKKKAPSHNFKCKEKKSWICPFIWIHTKSLIRSILDWDPPSIQVSWKYFLCDLADKPNNQTTKQPNNGHRQRWQAKHVDFSFNCLIWFFFICLAGCSKSCKIAWYVPMQASSPVMAWTSAPAKMSDRELTTGRHNVWTRILLSPVGEKMLFNKRQFNYFFTFHNGYQTKKKNNPGSVLVPLLDV